MEALQLFFEARLHLRHDPETWEMANRQDSPAIINDDGDPNTLQEMVDAESMGEVAEEDPVTLDPRMFSPSIALLSTVTFPYVDLAGNFQRKTLVSRPTSGKFLLLPAGLSALLSPTAVYTPYGLIPPSTTGRVMGRSHIY